MCLIAFAIQASARWPLVIAANRDEFFNRPALPLAAWTTPAGHPLLSGRDLRGGGTWLGITPGGRVAMLTNVRQGDHPVYAKSRGDLVTRWLESDHDAASFMAHTDPRDYGGFNLVTGDVQSGSWTWFCNRAFDAQGQAVDEEQWRFKKLGPGIYGLSNAELDTPWPKTTALTNALMQALLAKDEPALARQLKAALASRQRSTGPALPHTGVSLELEEILSSAYIADEMRGYGTRCSTLVIVGEARSGDWPVSIRETTHTLPAWPDALPAVPADTVTLSTSWPASSG